MTTVIDIFGKNTNTTTTPAIPNDRIRSPKVQEFPRLGAALILLYAAMTGVVPAAVEKDTDGSTVPLQQNLGAHRYPVSTQVPTAQNYFDQGLILTYGFNHAEAARSFKEAAKRDPNCAMCYWGQALVLGPNINSPMDDNAVPEAYSSIQKALSLSGNAKPKEQALIRALSRRYSEKPVRDRSSLDLSYANAMRKVSEEFPKDPVIAALFAESLMDLHPWNFWTKTGEAQPWTAEIVSTLERSLEFDVNNPLANHLYIHALEASPHPERALPSAKRLPNLVPGSGHLVHMPAHIYIRIGDYREAAAANQAAVKIDQNYLAHPHPESIYTKAYVPHNYHFLWAAAIKSGQSKLAMQAADQTAAKVDPEMLRDPAHSGTFQHFALIPLFSKALFGRWNEILEETEPASDLLYSRGIWHYARGLAFTRRKRFDTAGQELEKLRAIIQDPAIEKMKIFDLNPAQQILKIADATLAGELAAAQNDRRTAVKQLQIAVELEDGLNYTEPKDWYLPSRQVLGAIYLESDDAGAAEKVFRKDLEFHPQNGWSLFGLMQSLKAQGKELEARKVQTAYREVWQDADIELSNARF